MTWGMAAVAGATLVGGAMSAGAASSAADAQAQSAAQADGTQRYMYDTTRADNLPFLQNGTAANGKLAQLLGISSGTPNLLSTAGGVPTYNAQLYATNPAYKQAWDSLAAQHQAAYGTGYTPDSDTNWINSNLQSRLGPDGMAALTPQKDASFGSLLRPFSQADMEADPVYKSGLQFGLDQGTQGINRMAAAHGGLDSGATLKELTRFGNDYASTKGNDSYNRFMNTNQNQFNMLSGVSGTGQVAGGQVASAGQNMSNNISQNQIGVGNARAASMIGGANAFNGAIGTGVNAFQQNQMMTNYQNRTNALLGGGMGAGNSLMSEPYAGYNQSIGLA